MCKSKMIKEHNTLLQIEKYIYEYKIKTDETIFKIDNINLIGRYIYSQIIKSIDGVTTSQINRIVGRITKISKAEDLQEEYYKNLSNFLGIYNLPKECLKKSATNYQCLKKKYTDYVGNFEKKKEEIRRKIQSKQNKIKKIETKNNQSLIANISSDIDILRKYYLEIRSLETYQEIIEFDFAYIDNNFEDYCKKFLNSELNKNIILENACEYIRETRVDIPDKYMLMQHIIDVAISHLSSELNLFYNVKFQPIFETIYTNNISKYMSKELNGEQYNINLDFLEIPSISNLISLKTSNLEEYNVLLRKVIDKYDIIRSIMDVLNIYPPLSNKKELIFRCIEFFNNNDYCIFINLISIQIEALYYDLLIDSNMFNNFKKIELFNNKVLKEKIKTLNETTYIDITEYFSTYFNNLIRNAIAHGREAVPNTKQEQEAFALELMMDLNSLLFLYSKKSEILKMHRFILGVVNPITLSKDVETMKMEILFSTLCGNRLCDLHYTIDKYNPIQVVYWLLNPTYENIYKKAYDITLLKSVRCILIKTEFWRFCNAKIEDCINSGYDYLSIGPKFQSCVNLLLSVIKNSETKKELIKTNKKLKALVKLSKLN